jgi:ankyrin repeat protein
LNKLPRYTKQRLQIKVFDNLQQICRDDRTNTTLVEAAKLLIDNGADVNAKDTEDSTPLQSAAFSGSLMTMKLLVSEGAKLTTRDKEGSTPLHKASYQGHLRGVQFLLRSCREKERVAFINMVDDYGASALHHASLRGYPECAKYLIEKGASVNAEEKDGSTPLFKAVFGGQTDCARILLDAGADVDAKDILFTTK